MSPEYTTNWKRCIFIYLYMTLHSNDLMCMQLLEGKDRQDAGQAHARGQSAVGQ